MQEILNHAAFVPLPQNASETRVGDDLVVRQPINPFYEPVPLVKSEDTNEPHTNKSDQVVASLGKTVTIPTHTPLVDQGDVHLAKRPRVSFQLP